MKELDKYIYIYTLLKLVLPQKNQSRARGGIVNFAKSNISDWFQHRGCGTSTVTTRFQPQIFVGRIYWQNTWSKEMIQRKEPAGSPSANLKPWDTPAALSNSMHSWRLSLQGGKGEVFCVWLTGRSQIELYFVESFKNKPTPKISIDPCFQFQNLLSFGGSRSRSQKTADKQDAGMHWVSFD